VVSFLSYGQEVEQKVDNHVFNESPKSEISQWGLQKIIMLIFLELKIFCQIFTTKNQEIHHVATVAITIATWPDSHMSSRPSGEM
jgi:hypothetical protein